MTAKWPLMDRFWAPELAKQACSWAVNIGDWRCRLLRRMSPLVADIVAKVENRTTRRISLKSILRRACCRKALRRQYEGRWSFWYETMWSLMSPHAKRISGL